MASLTSSDPIIDGDLIPVEPDESPTPDSPSLTRRVALTWAVGACALLGVSATVRAVQDRRHKDEANFQEACPFPLEQIPRHLGRWQSSPDEQKLDSNTLLITGGKEYTIRTYTDESTGVRLLVLILFGPVEPVIPHTPDVCYPANGFKKADEPMSRTIKYSLGDLSEKPGEGHDATFRSAVYRKGRMLEGVYHSFRYGGVWSPDVGNGQKIPRRNPGVFKLQIQRLVAPGESRDGDKFPEPIEDFLRMFIPAIEKEIAKANAKSVAQATK